MPILFMWSGDIMMRYLVIGLLFASAAAHGAEFQIQCPVRYPSEDLSLSEVPKGWDGKATLRKGAILVGAGFYDGPEEMPAELIGTGQIKTKDGFETRYAVDTGPKRFTCAYGGGVELFHRLPVAVTRCVIKSKKQDSRHHEPDIRIFCE